MPPKKRDDNWIDGLRGVASFIVVTGHICTAFVPYLHSPAMSENGSPVLFQLPFLRLCVGGRAAVAVFFIVTGFVNSINPVKNARMGNTELALSNLAKSTFTRSGRLVIPTNVAVFIAWLLCQLGAFELASHTDTDWIRLGAHAPDSSLWDSLVRLFRALVLFWGSGLAEYDPTHWTLVFFLQGSFRVYLALLATMLVTIRYRCYITIFLYIYAWCTGDYLVGMNIFAGLLLAQLQVEFGSRATSILPKPFPAILIILGLFMASYPQEDPEWVFWSRGMKEMASAVTPMYHDISRYWVSVGVTTLMVGIFFSRNARLFLTLPLFNFLGRVSFPVYLLHNTLIRTVLTWMVYGASALSAPQTSPRSTDTGDLGQHPVYLQRVRPLAFIFILPIFYTIMYAIAHQWVLRVDPLCARMVEWTKKLLFAEEVTLGAEKPTPLMNIS